MSRYKTWRGELPRWQQLLKMLQEHDSDECLPWPYRVNSNGYGTVLYEDSTWRVPRLAFKFAYGRIYRSLFVLHSCDNPPCFNPKHLHQGTQKENLTEMTERGRRSDGNPGVPNPSNQGSKNGNAKLTEDKVREIKLRFQNGQEQKQIALAVGTSEMTVSLIVRGKYWRHILL